MFRLKFFERNIILIVAIWMIIPGIFCAKSGGTVFYDCPAFKDPFYEQWFPYVQSQVINFKNNGGSEGKLTIDRVEKTPDYKYYTTGGGSCVPRVTVRSSDNNNSSIPFLLEYGIADQANGLYIGFKNIVINARNIKDTGLNQLSGASLRFNHFQFLTTYTIRGKTYPSVQIITRDTALDKANDIYKIIIAKQIGILAFEEYPSLELWVKQ